MDTATETPEVALAGAIEHLLTGVVDGVTRNDVVLTIDAAGLAFTLTVAPVVPDKWGHIKVGDVLSHHDLRPDGESRCLDEDRATGRQCSNIRGHTGQHIAIYSGTVRAVWGGTPVAGGAADPLVHIRRGDRLSSDQWAKGSDNVSRRCGNASRDGYLCTRWTGHPGQHIGTYSDGDVVAVWPNESAGAGTSDPLAHVAEGMRPDPTGGMGGCRTISPRDRWVCTRDPGHPGQHIAGDGDCVLEVWQRTPPAVDWDAVRAGDPDPTRGLDEPDPCNYDIAGDACTRPDGHSGNHVSGRGGRVRDVCDEDGDRF